MEFLLNEPEEVDRFIAEALKKLPEGGTYFDTALSYASESALGQLVPSALAICESSKKRSAADSLLLYTSLQFPNLMHPYLTEIYEVRPNAGTYYENWPWRDSGSEATEFLERRITFDDESVTKAWECLLEQRLPKSIRFALDHVDRANLHTDPNAYLFNVGFETPLHSLYTDDYHHLVFSADYFRPNRPAWVSRVHHPTWRLPGAGREFRFGGKGSTECGLCGGTLHHLITLPANNVFEGQSGVANVEVEVCLSCLGWEEQTLHYSHAECGRPKPLNAGEVTPEFPAVTLRETLVRLASTPPRWRWQEWGPSNSRENLNRIGGHPSWIQSAQYPECMGCGQTMHFFAQLDSDLPTSDGGEWLWGSGGICYCFSCSTCTHTAFFWQCT